MDFVDRHAAASGAGNRLPAHLDGLVHEALVRCDPDIADGREEASLARREVVFDFHGETAATATMTATLDLMDAVDLDATISDLCTSMGRLGDRTSLGVRRAHALGLLANPQRAPELLGVDDSAPQEVIDQRADEERSVRTRWHAATTTLYLHVTAADLRAGAGVSSVDRLESATLYHIDAYVDPDDGGPPGQTSVAGLACLCRRHHRLKTFTAWRYRRVPDGGYAWTDPFGTTYSAAPGPGPGSAN